MASPIISASSSKKRKRTSNWSREETLCFLCSCRENDIVKKMDGKRFRWIDVMSLVKKDMAESHMHFIRDEDALVTKFKALKLAYHNALEHNNKSGNSPSSFQYLQEMEDIFGARPRQSFPLLYAVERTDEEGKFNPEINLELK